MGLLSTTIAPAAGAIASANVPPPPPARADSAATIAQGLATNAALGNAAIVTLSGSSKSRAASSGENRHVDAAFEDQKIQEKKEEEKEGKGKGVVEGTTVKKTGGHDYRQDATLNIHQFTEIHVIM